MSEHQAGKVLGWKPSGIKILGRRSTPGRYFPVAEPGTRWGGTKQTVRDSGPFDSKLAQPGQSLMMVSTTGENRLLRTGCALRPIEMEMPDKLRHRLQGLKIVNQP